MSPKPPKTPVRNLIVNILPFVILASIGFVAALYLGSALITTLFVAYIAVNTARLYFVLRKARQANT